MSNYAWFKEGVSFVKSYTCPFSAEWKVRRATDFVKQVHNSSNEKSVLACNLFEKEMRRCLKSKNCDSEQLVTLANDVSDKLGIYYPVKEGIDVVSST